MHLAWLVLPGCHLAGSGVMSVTAGPLARAGSAVSLEA